MQTFLPFPDFDRSVECLDIKRLRCQIKEAHQIINGQWKHHPANLMWINNQDALKLYFNVVLTEYKSQGFDHKFDLFEIPKNAQMPLWLGNKTFHLSQMINLLRKDFFHYNKYFSISFPAKFPDGYFWPVANGTKSKQNSQEWENFVLHNPDVFDSVQIKF